VIGNRKKIAGLTIDSIVTVVTYDSTDNHVLVESECKRNRGWFRQLDLEPVYEPKQTLFEAAKDAPYGTFFKLDDRTATIRNDQVAVWCKHGEPLNSVELQRTDFEIIPPGPRKAENIPEHLVGHFIKAQKQLADLLKWESVKLHEWRHSTDSSIYLMVTYDTDEQRDAAFADLKL
jgi:hypothetical protein